MNAVTPDLDQYSLQREIDRVKSELFTHKFAAFYGSLLCSLNFMWDSTIKTAATDGVNLIWNPEWFLSLPYKSRVTVLMHEVQHCARLHFARMGERHPKIWNFACDTRMNNDLEDDGYSFVGIEDCWKDHNFPKDMPEEDIYDNLIANGIKIPINGVWGSGLGSGSGDGDMLPAPPGISPKDQIARAINNVVRATHQARQSGAGNVPGDVETILKVFLAPVVPWEQLFQRFMQDLFEGGYSWRKPNRRFADIYLPSAFEDDGALSHLIYFEDTSGSISDADATRFNSEFKYVKDCFRPKKMTLVQFDTIIQQVLEYGEDDPFDQVTIKGRGGTSLTEVRQYILDHRPTAAVVFSDMHCDPMEPLGFEIPIIWVCISNRGAKVPFGQIIHIR